MSENGLCECGCGQKTTPAQQAWRARGLVAGQPQRFVHGHNRRRPAEQRFWAKVKKTDGCWLWTASVFARSGYGEFGLNGKMVTAHRYSFLLNVGPIGPGLFVCHACDNRLCVRPDHLFLGTHQENVADCKSKRRTVSGAKNGMAKLTGAQVLAIRRDYIPGKNARELAEKYGVRPGHVWRVAGGGRWNQH